MENIVGINSKKVDQQTIDTLKELVSKAESGELQSIMFVDRYHDGTCGMGWSGTPNHQMMGKLDELKFDFFSQMYFPSADE